MDDIVISISILICAFTLLALIAIAHLRGGKCAECDGDEADTWGPCGTCGGTGIYPEDGKTPRGGYNPHSCNDVVSTAPGTSVKTGYRRKYLGVWTEKDMKANGRSWEYHKGKKGL